MPLRSGEIPAAELVEVRPGRLSSNIAVFVHQRGRVSIMVTKGFEQFAESVSRVEPDLPIRIGWRAGLAERLPGSSRTRTLTASDADASSPSPHVTRLPAPTGPPSSLAPPPTPTMKRDRFRVRYLAPLLLPIGALVLFITFWKPGVDPIVNMGDGPFFVATVIRNDGMSLRSPTEDLTDPSDQLLAAACHNYFDWLDDVTLSPDQIILDPDNGLLRSAELLDGGGFEPTEPILEAERLTISGLSPSEILDQLAENGVSDSDRDQVGEYLEARQSDHPTAIRVLSRTENDAVGCGRPPRGRPRRGDQAPALAHVRDTGA